MKTSAWSEEEQGNEASLPSSALLASGLWGRHLFPRWDNVAFLRKFPELLLALYRVQSTETVIAQQKWALSSASLDLSCSKPLLDRTQPIEDL